MAPLDRDLVGITIDEVSGILGGVADDGGLGDEGDPGEPDVSAMAIPFDYRLRALDDGDVGLGE